MRREEEKGGVYPRIRASSALQDAEIMFLDQDDAYKDCRCLKKPLLMDKVEIKHLNGDDTSRVTGIPELPVIFTPVEAGNLWSATHLLAGEELHFWHGVFQYFMELHLLFPRRRRLSVPAEEKSKNHHPYLILRLDEEDVASFAESTSSDAAPFAASSSSTWLSGRRGRLRSPPAPCRLSACGTCSARPLYGLISAICPDPVQNRKNGLRITARIRENQVLDGVKVDMAAVQDHHACDHTDGDEIKLLSRTQTEEELQNGGMEISSEREERTSAEKTKKRRNNTEKKGKKKKAAGEKKPVMEAPSTSHRFVPVSQIARPTQGAAAARIRSNACKGPEGSSCEMKPVSRRNLTLNGMRRQKGLALHSPRNSAQNAANVIPLHGSSSRPASAGAEDAGKSTLLARVTLGVVLTSTTPVPKPRLANKGSQPDFSKPGYR
ncbi:hypothetical protein F2P79_018628 [Pimephales promelas]|nr:hypothetical protein F2P79_018628 [Pimephales promelas]